MGSYQKIIVGTDGSDTSLRAVDRAGAIAGDSSAELVIVCAYEPAGRDEVLAASDALKEDAYQVVGFRPRRERAARRGRPGPLRVGPSRSRRSARRAARSTCSARRWRTRTPTCSSSGASA